MPKTIFLHIGTHKTGTTSIQHLLAQAGDVLRGQGILYPTAGRPSGSGEADWGHHVLTWAIRGKRGVQDETSWHQLRSEIEQWPGERVVLSAEGFSRATADQVTNVRTLLADYDVRIFLYLRNPLDWLKSSYKQRVKTGNISDSFNAYVREELGKIDYAALIEKWETRFGSGSVHVRLFDKVKREPGIEADFCRLVGVDYKEIATMVGRPKNISPNDHTIKLVRWLNRGAEFFRMSQHPLVRRVRRKMWRAQLSRHRIEAIGTLMQVGPLVTTTDVDWLRAVTAEMRHRFLTTYVQADDHHLFQF